MPIECQLCGKEFTIITNTHLKKHDMTTQEYKERFDVLWSDEHIERQCKYLAINHPMKGKCHTPETKEKMRQAQEKE